MLTNGGGHLGLMRPRDETKDGRLRVNDELKGCAVDFSPHLATVQNDEKRAIFKCPPAKHPFRVVLKRKKRQITKIELGSRSALRDGTSANVSRFVRRGTGSKAGVKKINASSLHASAGQQCHLFMSARINPLFFMNARLDAKTS